MNFRPRKHARQRAFTLIELLVVIGILLLIIGFALPALMNTIKGANKIRSAADLSAVSTALDAFRADHGDYPRPSVTNTGFAELGRALVGPGGAGGSAPAPGAPPFFAGDCVLVSGFEYVCFAGPDPSLKYQTNTGPTAPSNWAQFPYSDNHAGPGIKVRAGATQTYGPYLDPAKFRTRGVALLDANDNPILYFPARPGKVAQPTDKPWALVSAGVQGSVYNSNDNVIFFQRPGDTVNTNAMQRMHAVLIEKATNYDGLVQVGEAAVTTAPYLLWAAGEDGVFGAGKPNAVGAPVAADVKACDDVTNFRGQ